eukprot:4159238-Pyramimonas_sp.AAC.1
MLWWAEPTGFQRIPLSPRLLSVSPPGLPQVRSSASVSRAVSPWAAAAPRAAMAARAAKARTSRASSSR